MFLLDRRALFIGAAGFIIWPDAAAFAQSSERAGVAEEVIGEVSAETGDKRRPLAATGPVYVGDSVATAAASKVGMRLGKDTILRLGERARITIDRFLVDAGGTIQLSSGPLFFEKAKGTPPVNIRSPFGLISVRGTQLFAGPSKGVFGVFVVRGEVVVTNANQTVEVGAGFGTDVANASAPPTAPARWGDERIRLALASVG